MSKIIKLPGRVESAEVGGIVTGANAIMDDAKGKVQGQINSETDAELLRLQNEKQDNITVDGAPTEGSNNPVASGGVYTAEKALSDAIEAILLLIPSAATALNKLADKEFVASSIATSTATFNGTFNLVSDLHLSADATHEEIAQALDALGLDADANDYCFVQVPESDTSEDIKVTQRYKFNGMTWAYEYDLNNSGFTAEQWAAINSNITAALTEKLMGLPTSEVLAGLLAGKQDVLTFDEEPTAGSNNPVTSGGVYQANNDIIALINALDQAKQDVLTFDQSPVQGSSNPVTSGGVYDAIYLVQTVLATLGGNVETLQYSVGLLTEQVGILNTLYQALTQSDIIVGALPGNGVANRVYRVPGTSTYSDWMWYDGAWVKLAEYTVLDGYMYKGIATPNGSPSASAVKMFYFAMTPGTYTNFGNLVVKYGINILKYDGANWTLENLGNSDGVFDVTEYSGSSFASLEALLSDANLNNLIPVGVRKGGMSIKYVCSSDNNYVQFRYMIDDATTAATFTDVSNWQGVDDKPTAGSKNLVESGGVELSVAELQLDVTGVLQNSLFVRNGIPYYKSDGTELTGTGRKRTPLIHVVEGDIFDGTLQNSDEYYLIAAFNANKELVGSASVAGGSGVSYSYIVPSGVSYIQFCVNNSFTPSVKKKTLPFVDDIPIPESEKLLKSGGAIQVIFLSGFKRSDVIPALNDGEYGYNIGQNKVFYKVDSQTIQELIPNEKVLYLYNGKVYTNDGSKMVETCLNAVQLSLIGTTTSITSNLQVGQYGFEQNSKSIYYKVDSDGFVIKAATTNMLFVYDSEIYVFDGLELHKTSYNRELIDILASEFSVNRQLEVGYMATGSVGSTATFEVSETSVSWRHLKEEVKAGDIYIIKNASTGTTPKSYTLTDTNAVVLKVEKNIFSGIVVVEQDGYLVVNGTIANNVSVSKYGTEYVDKIVDTKIIQNNTLNLLDDCGLFQGFLTTSGRIRTDSSDAAIYIYSGKILGEHQIILPNGWLCRRLCYYKADDDSFISYQNIDANSVSISSNVGYCRISLYKNGTPAITPKSFPINNIGARPYGVSPYNPLLRFDIDYNLRDFADELQGVTFNGTFIEQLYAKMDALVALYPNIVTKYDPMASAVSTESVTVGGTTYTISINTLTDVLTGMTSAGYSDYPSYAKGGNPGNLSEFVAAHPELTPVVSPYKTFVYKLNYNGGNIYAEPKKKILLNGATHGWEIAGAFNLYLLALGLCKEFNSNQFFMKLLSGYEIWIVPCLNGYGIRQQLRQNGNGVNINRNAPTANWQVQYSPWERDYTGDSAGSEFETQLIVNLAKYINPSFFIDHHNYNSSNRQFYTDGHDVILKKPAFQSLVDMSFCYLKNLPNYFGTDYQIFMHEASDLPAELGVAEGLLSLYIAQTYTPFSMTLEIGNGIMYLNGTYTQNNPKHTNDVFKVGEYSLRCQMSHYLNTMMDNVAE